MYSLLQLILLLNPLQTPVVNVLTHFDTLKGCEIKLDETYKRNFAGGNDAKIIKNSENNKYLKIEFKNESTVSYWFCKQTIFYK